MADSTNLLLRTLGSRTLASLSPHDEDHPIGTILVQAKEVPESVFFPWEGGVVSIVRSTEGGGMVEAGVVGNEGMFHVQTIFAAPAATGSQGLVQNEGRFTRINARVLREHFQKDASFRDSLLAFTNAFLTQVSQNLACNRLHGIEQRLAKWLLIVRDRISSDELHLTQEFLSHMLGVHRPGVSLAVSALELDGLIKHGRKWITIQDRKALLARSCECYPVVNEALVTLREQLSAA